MEKVHDAIYNLDYGVKSFSHPVTEKAKQDLMEVVLGLKQKGVQAIVLGCSELPLVFTEKEYCGVDFIDPNLILAEVIIKVQGFPIIPSLDK